MPEKDEGFDEVRCSWGKDGKAATVLKEWILQRKLTTRIEDLKPSEWFNQKWKHWQMVLQSWIGAQTEYKARQSRRQSEKAQRLQKKAQADIRRKLEEQNKAKAAKETKR